MTIKSQVQENQKPNFIEELKIRKSVAIDQIKNKIDEVDLIEEEIKKLENEK